MMDEELKRPWPDVDREYFGFSTNGASVFCLDKKSQQEVARWCHVAAQVEEWRLSFNQYKDAYAANHDTAIARAEAAEAERDNAVSLSRLHRNAIKRAYGDLWRDARSHSGLIASARMELLKALTHDEQREAVEASIQRHGPVTESDIIEIGKST